ncbi:MAG: pseudouridine synthase [Pararhizobium sp.]
MTPTDKPRRPRTKPAEGQGPHAQPAAGAEVQGAPERIAKILARAGVASRRDAERMVMEGRIAVNGTVLTTPAFTATLADRIEVDGLPIRGIERTRLWLYYKPAGLVTTNSDPEGRPTVFENLPADLPRVLSVGRLDINTEGLLLLTNDGGLARVLELPATGWLRRYRVRAHGDVDQAALDRLKEGIAVDGVLYGAIDATLDRTQGSNVWITMGLREGKNREIKNVLGALGLEVNRLIRISYGPFQLADLAEGAVREIRGRTLRDQLGPRLIAESGANFEAPVFEREDAGGEPAAPAPEKGRPEKERPARRDDRSPEDKRERALARLDTRRDDRKKDDRPKHRPVSRNRSSNVWMAPGARPLGPKQAEAAEKARERAERKSSGRAGRPASKAARFDNAVAKDGPRKPKPRSADGFGHGGEGGHRASSGGSAGKNATSRPRERGEREEARSPRGAPSGKTAFSGRSKDARGASAGSQREEGFRPERRGGKKSFGKPDAAGGARSQGDGPARFAGKGGRPGKPGGKGGRPGQPGGAGGRPRGGAPRGGKPGADRRR